jgi:membrane-anchored protein YejM (alkaline phosphatase superfamily)
MRIYLALFLATLIGQGIHAWGYAHNMKAIISLTHTIPWYTQLTSTTDIKKFGLFNEALLEENLNLAVGDVTGFRYPAEPLNCVAPAGAGSRPRPNIVVAVIESWRFDRMSAEVTPNIAAIGQESLVFSNHLSTGTVTDKGMFGLVYGVSPVYFNEAVGAGKETTIIPATKALGYEHWILANQDIEVNKLDTLLFKGIKPLQSLPKGAVYEGDRLLVSQFKQLLTQHAVEQPFFSLMLFNSSHFPYWTPPELDSPFQPAERFAISKANDSTDRTPYFNQYSNSLHYLDRLVGEIRQSLIDEGEWDNSILVITGDHGEEFGEQEPVCWGHGSNFSRYQASVPLVIHWPGRSGQVDYRTSHEDIMPTLITEALGCNGPVASRTTGYSLFDDSDRVLMVESYVNQAVIVGDSVSEILPGFVLSYSLDDIDQPTQASAASLVGIQAIYDRFR